MPHNLWNTLQSFEPNPGKSGQFYSLPQLEKEGIGPVSKLPVSIRVVLESVLRNFDGTKITEDDVRAYIDAIEYHLPTEVVTNDDLAREFPEWSVEQIAEKTKDMKKEEEKTQKARNRVLTAESPPPPCSTDVRAATECAVSPATADAHRFAKVFRRDWSRSPAFAPGATVPRSSS